MTKVSHLHRRWNKDAGYKDSYDALGEEFDLARALIDARIEQLGAAQKKKGTAVPVE